VRDTLGLAEEGNDFHVSSVLAALASFPDMMTMAEPSVELWDVHDFTRPSPVMTAGTLVPRRGNLPVFAPNALEAPAPYTITVSWISEGARVVYGSNRWDVEASPFNNVPYKLIIEWPSELGVSGDIELDVAWNKSSVVTLSGWAKAYPYALAADKLSSKRSTIYLLSQAGVVENFFLSSDSVEKIAVIALALAITHPSHS
jgi:hypothetical protein